MGILILILQIIATAFFVYWSGWCYHRGGDQGGKPVRLFGVPALALVTFLAWYGLPHGLLAWILVILTYPVMIASLSSYYKKKGADAMWWNWALVGLGFGLSKVLLTVLTGHWLWFVIQVGVSTIVTTSWCVIVSRVSPEEGGRGGIFTLGVPFICFK